MANEIETLYRRYLTVTENPQAAATLVVAHQIGQQEESLTVGEASARLGCAPATIYKLCRSGQLPYHRVGRAIRIPADSLGEFRADSRAEEAPRIFRHLRL